MRMSPGFFRIIDLQGKPVSAGIASDIGNGMLKRILMSMCHG